MIPNKTEEDFSDIINSDWPQKSTHQKMNLNNRAKIFLPFAALKGFEEEIDDRQLASEKANEVVHTHNLEDNS